MEYIKINLLICWAWMGGAVWAQAPDWRVSPNQYSNSMLVTAVLELYSVESRDTGDVVAAFVGNQVRGVAKPITYLANRDRYVVQLLVYSNTAGEQVRFKLYDKSANRLTDAVIAPVAFSADGVMGSLAQPFVIKDNHVPTDISLSANTLPENAQPWTVVGNLAATDANAGDTQQFRLVAGQGDADNALFAIEGNTLRNKSPFDFENGTSFSVRIAVEDSRNGIFAKSFQITVADQIEDKLSFNNIVTPNGDGYNDALQIFNLGLYENYKLLVYDLRGQVVFESTDYANDWSPSHLQAGLYFVDFRAANTSYVYRERLTIVKE